MLTIQEEKWDNCREEIAALIEHHWNEVAWYKDTVPLDPNWEQYQLLADKDILHAFIAREEGEMVGYAIFFVTPNLHYKTTLCAENDIMYITPSHRRTTAAQELIEYSKLCLGLVGAHVMSIKMKYDHPFHSLLHRCGMKPMEYNYSVKLGG